MNKKAQVNNISSFILIVGSIAVTLVISLMVLSTLKDTVTEQIYGYVDSSGTGVLTQTLTTSKVAITFGTDEVWKSLTSIKPNATFEARINQTESTWAGNASYLRFRGLLNTTINASKISVYNGSTLVASGNYTISQVSTNAVKLQFIDSTYNSNNLSIIYNRTFSTSDDFTGTSLCYITTDCPLFTSTGNTTNSAYGVKSDSYNVSVKTVPYTTNTELLGQVYNVVYVKTTRTMGTGTSDSSSAIDDMVTNLSKIPVWIGILIIIVLASIVLGYFGFRQD